MNAETLASWTTAAGTLVLAVATFSSTRSANRASRTAERALLAGLRPVLMHARLEDPRQKVGFMDQRWLVFEGAGGAIEVTDDAIYMAAAIPQCRHRYRDPAGLAHHGGADARSAGPRARRGFHDADARHLHPRG